MTTRRKWFIQGALLLAFVCLVLAAYKAQTGTGAHGVSSTVKGIPYIGKYLGGLELTGDIKYVCFRRYTRPVRAVLFTGMIQETKLIEFFGERVERTSEGSSFNWSAILDSMGADPIDFPVGSSPDDLFAYRELNVDGRLLVLRATYRKEGRMLTVYALETWE